MYKRLGISPRAFSLPFQVTFSTPGFQYILPTEAHLIPYVHAITSDPVIVQNLNITHVPEMISLTDLTKPGPFSERTIEFDNYVGIFINGQLVAMGGERMQMPIFTELSALCTHPSYLGRGFGSIILSYLANRVFRNGKIPFLHVRANNTNAIKLYERLGFVKRADMLVTLFTTPDV